MLCAPFQCQPCGANAPPPPPRTGARGAGTLEAALERGALRDGVAVVGAAALRRGEIEKLAGALQRVRGMRVTGAAGDGAAGARSETHCDLDAFPGLVFVSLEGCSDTELAGVAAGPATRARLEALLVEGARTGGEAQTAGGEARAPPAWLFEGLVSGPMLKLRLLRLASCGLFELPLLAAAAPRLRCVDVSGNFLGSAPALLRALEGLVDLERVDAARNALRDGGDGPACPANWLALGNVSTLNLADNRLQTTRGLELCRGLADLDVGGNEISSLRCASRLARLPLLRSVTFQGNPLQASLANYRVAVLHALRAHRRDTADVLSLDGLKVTRAERRALDRRKTWPHAVHAAGNAADATGDAADGGNERRCAPSDDGSVSSALDCDFVDGECRALANDAAACARAYLDDAELECTKAHVLARGARCNARRTRRNQSRSLGPNAFAIIEDAAALARPPQTAAHDDDAHEDDHAAVHAAVHNAVHADEPPTPEETKVASTADRKESFAEDDSWASADGRDSAAPSEAAPAREAVDGALGTTSPNSERVNEERLQALRALQAPAAGARKQPSDHAAPSPPLTPRSTPLPPSPGAAAPVEAVSARRFDDERLVGDDVEGYFRSHVFGAPPRAATMACAATGELLAPHAGDAFVSALRTRLHAVSPRGADGRPSDEGASSSSRPSADDDGLENSSCSSLTSSANSSAHSAAHAGGARRARWAAGDRAAPARRLSHLDARGREAAPSAAAASRPPTWFDRAAADAAAPVDSIMHSTDGSIDVFLVVTSARLYVFECSPALLAAQCGDAPPPRLWAVHRLASLERCVIGFQCLWLRLLFEADAESAAAEYGFITRDKDATLQIVHAVVPPAKELRLYERVVSRLPAGPGASLGAAALRCTAVAVDDDAATLALVSSRALDAHGDESAVGYFTLCSQSWKSAPPRLASDRVLVTTARRAYLCADDVCETDGDRPLHCLEAFEWRHGRAAAATGAADVTITFGRLHRRTWRLRFAHAQAASDALAALQRHICIPALPTT
ncbi:hypothetical protein M885DRAFT_528322 [Pelagophyceae sp. CCMP2097]|nr:hypothetical protein M885DRAFT_528322 [Pelagophyceae sp. CCMP2097]